jgi:RNA polymerase sigma factor (sigma-70 family)
LAASAFGDLAAEKEQPDFQPDTHGVFRWLFNRIASKARREKNKNKRRRPLDSLAASGDGRHAAAEPPDSSPGPGQQSADNDWLANLLGRLKPREQEIVTLILQGYRKKEIAEQLGCDKTTLWRAMKKIAECAFGNDHRAH